MLLLKKAALLVSLAALFSSPALTRPQLKNSHGAHPTADSRIKERVRTFSSSGCHNALLKVRITSGDDQMPLRI